MFFSLPWMLFYFIDTNSNFKCRSHLLTNLAADVLVSSNESYFIYLLTFFEFHRCVKACIIFFFLNQILCSTKEKLKTA